jgi:hypothetical protein
MLDLEICCSTHILHPRSHHLSSVAATHIILPICLFFLPPLAISMPNGPDPLLLNNQDPFPDKEVQENKPWSRLRATASNRFVSIALNHLQLLNLNNQTTASIY